MAEHIHAAFSADFDARSTVRGMQGIADEDADIEGEDMEEGVVYEQGDLRVTAFLVDHVVIEPAFGFRVDYEGRSIVLSGDTRYNENVVSYAAGADLLGR